MTPAEQTSKIHRAITLSTEIKQRTEELDKLKDEFRLEAEREIKAHGTGDLPGQSWTFNTEPVGHVAGVSFPKIGLLNTLVFINKVPHRYAEDPKGGREKILVPIEADVRGLCGEHFTKLWMPYFKPAKAFTELVGAMLKPKPALELLESLAEPPGTARVKFDVAK